MAILQALYCQLKSWRQLLDRILFFSNQDLAKFVLGNLYIFSLFFFANQLSTVYIYISVQNSQPEAILEHPDLSYESHQYIGPCIFMCVYIYIYTDSHTLDFFHFAMRFPLEGTSSPKSRTPKGFRSSSLEVPDFGQVRQ